MFKMIRILRDQLNQVTRCNLCSRLKIFRIKRLTWTEPILSISPSKEIQVWVNKTNQLGLKSKYKKFLKTKFLSTLMFLINRINRLNTSCALLPNIFRIKRPRLKFVNLGSRKLTLKISTIFKQKFMSQKFSKICKMWLVKIWVLIRLIDGL